MAPGSSGPPHRRTNSRRVGGGRCTVARRTCGQGVRKSGIGTANAPGNGEHQETGVCGSLKSFDQAILLILQVVTALSDF